MTKTMTATATHEFKKLHNDAWADEVRLIGEDGPVLRLATFYRFKTLGLSGSMWRTSTCWQALPGLMKGAEPNERTPGWESFDGGYGRGLMPGCSALYPTLCAHQEHAHGLTITRTEFLRKGAVLWSTDHGGGARTLLAAAGHMSWALVMFGNQPSGSTGIEHYRDLCHQPGCEEKHASVYQLKKQTGRRIGGERVPLMRHFCPMHLKRGDNHSVDCDSNYEVLSGLGPEGAVGWLKCESRATLVR